MRPFDPEKDKYWRKVLKAWKASGLSLSEFGRREDIRLNTLCTWREVIARRDTAIAAEKNRTESTSRERIQTSAPLKSGSVNQDDFVSVILTEHPQDARKPEPDNSRRTALEITFANGATMLVHEHCAPALLATAMELMENPHV